MDILTDTRNLWLREEGAPCRAAPKGKPVRPKVLYRASREPSHCRFGPAFTRKSALAPFAW